MKTQAGFCVSLVIVTCLVAPWLDYFVLAWRMAYVSASTLVSRMCSITGAAFLSRLENSFSSPNCCPADGLLQHVWSDLTRLKDDEQ